MSPTHTGETVKTHGRRIGRRRGLVIGSALLPPVIILGGILAGCGSSGSNAGTKSPAAGTSSPATPKGTRSPVPKVTHIAEPKPSGTSPTSVATPSRALLSRLESLFDGLSGPNITTSSATQEANGSTCLTKVEGAGTIAQKAVIFCVSGADTVTQFGTDVQTSGTGGPTEAIRGMDNTSTDAAIGKWVLSGRTIIYTVAGTPKPGGVTLQNNLPESVVEAGFTETVAAMANGAS